MTPDRFLITDLPLPPSENEIYSDSARGRIVRRYLNKTGKDYKRDVSALLNATGYTTRLREFVEQHVEVELHIFLFRPNWHTKAGLPNCNAGDASNRVKILQDVLFEAIGINDCRAFFTGVRKLHGPEKANIVFTPMSEVTDYF